MTISARQSGCSLPENLRLHYLDVMGIQSWRQYHPDEPDAEQTLTEQEIAERWHALQQQVSGCTLCKLHESRTQTVFGVGNKKADLLVIGEAPGRDEDLQGEPFVGRAGRLLNAMLAAIGLQREQVYIANILKCRPPNNRDPQPEEAECCNPYLRQQIELIQPKVILAVGRIAAQILLDTDVAIGKLRGRQHHYQGIPLIVSYHPAYLLRKPTEKRKSWQDLLQLKKVLKGCP